MRIDRITQNFGDPDFKIGFFHLWVHNRPYRETTDNEFDSDWFTVTILYESPALSVSDNGTFLMLSDLKHFLGECEKLYATLSGTAELSSPYEPNVKILLKAGSSGHIGAVYQFEPNLHIQIKCEDEFDQSYLKQAISGLINAIHRMELEDA